MKKRSKRAERSSILPKRLKRRVWGIIERRLPLRWIDRITQFSVQTRLIFSKTILVMLLALVVFFTWVTLEKGTFREKEVFGFLVVQTIVLTVLLHMNLWETEREAKTFELLLMRVPETGRLIWFKLRASLFWTFVLCLPFFCGMWWFATLSTSHALLFLLFNQTTMILVALFTCVVASFVRRGLPTGILTAILVWFVAIFTEEMKFLAYRHYYRPFINPFAKEFEFITTFELTTILVGNRVTILIGAVLMYLWLRTRLRSTEKWAK